MRNAILAISDPLMLIQTLQALRQNGFGGVEVIHARTEGHLAQLIAAKGLKRFVAVIDTVLTLKTTALRWSLEFNADVYHDPIEPAENVRGERVSDTAGY